MSELLHKTLVNSNELETLLEQRAKGEVDFVLVDVREQIEYDIGHIKGVDILKPTSTFKIWKQDFINQYIDKTIIFTCRTGARSGSVQNTFQQNGMRHIINHFGGIISYTGEIEK